MAQKTKKEIYNESSNDLRTYINGELAIKPYYYYRNGLLHVRYIVDRCFELTREESDELKKEMSHTQDSTDKQTVLANAWQNLSDNPDKELIKDGIIKLEERMKCFRNQNKEDNYDD